MCRDKFCVTTTGAFGPNVLTFGCCGDMSATFSAKLMGGGDDDQGGGGGMSNGGGGGGEWEERLVGDPI